MVRYLEEVKHSVKYFGVEGEVEYKKASEMVLKSVHGDEEMKRQIASY